MTRVRDIELENRIRSSWIAFRIVQLRTGPWSGFGASGNRALFPLIASIHSII